MTFHYIYKYSQVHLQRSVWTISKTLFLTSLYIAQSQVHWEQLIDDRSQESSKNGVKIYPFWEGFTKFQLKNTSDHNFAKLALKYPYFHEIWDTH